MDHPIRIIPQIILLSTSTTSIILSICCQRHSSHFLIRSPCDHGHHDHSSHSDECDSDGGSHDHHHGHNHEASGHGNKEATDINIQAAYMHVIADTVQSIAVALAGLVIWIFPTWQIVDPVATFFFSILVLS